MDQCTDLQHADLCLDLCANRQHEHVSVRVRPRDVTNGFALPAVVRRRSHRRLAGRRDYLDPRDVRAVVRARSALGRAHVDVRSRDACMHTVRVRICAALGGGTCAAVLLLGGYRSAAVPYICRVGCVKCVPSRAPLVVMCVSW